MFVFLFFEFVYAIAQSNLVNKFKAVRLGRQYTSVGLFCCLFLCRQDYSKPLEWISTKLGGEMGHGPRQNPFNYSIFQGHFQKIPRDWFEDLEQRNRVQLMGTALHTSVDTTVAEHLTA